MTVLAFDQYWQHPAITEMHAWQQLQRQQMKPLQGVVYLAFPWATLFDLKDRNAQSETYRQLLAALDKLSAQVRPYSRVVTVCQHIRLRRHLAFLKGANVTDVFWSHAAVDEHFSDLNVLPFPLYPVNQVTAKPLRERAYVASFLGAAANQYYPTQSRNKLPGLFSHIANCYITLNDSWHFNDVVYQQQVSAEQFHTANVPFYDKQYGSVLMDSVFALCPAGTGPNSIRLWEAINAGVIPVIISDNYNPPGNLALWQQACVFCGETDAELAALPGKLLALWNNTELLLQKEAAVKQLQFLYAPQNFVADVAALLYQAETAYLLNTPLQQMANRVLMQDCDLAKRTLRLSMESYALLGNKAVLPDFVQFTLRRS